MYTKIVNLFATEVYLNSIVNCLNHGVRRGSRVGPVLETLNESIAFDMEYPFVATIERKLSYRYMFAEAHWIISGSNELNHNPSVTLTQKPWANDFGRLEGAYGPMYAEQVSYVLNLLKHDLSSRQAVISVWRPRPAMSKDIPCVCLYQFLIRENKLHMVVTMRSNDIWLGRPNDWAVYTLLATDVLLQLNHYLKSFGTQLSLGLCYVNTGSAHIYEKDIVDCHRIANDKDVWNFKAWKPGMTYPEFRMLLRQLAFGEKRDALDFLTNGHT
jgi:thymidylate synthase